VRSGAKGRHPASVGGRQRVRIIGGAWRSRRLEFPALPDLRPTPDRVRETLFNWLQGVIPGSRCLDLFAGSGALGFEAASRGADCVVMVDISRAVIDQLQRQALALHAEGIEIVQADALAYLKRRPPPFDIVFVDPPFATPLVSAACLALDGYDALKPGARIYLEMEVHSDPELPPAWDTLRSGRAGDVAYRLMGRDY
jgi:16S rRNA (guanine966-N2)-methyltransferase